MDLAKAFELPLKAPRRYALRSPWKEDASAAAVELGAGESHSFDLGPFEVVVFEARPR